MEGIGNNNASPVCYYIPIAQSDVANGVRGAMSFAVAQRTRELGVRSALGAQGGQLILLIMRKGVIQLVIGLFLGLDVALLASG